MPIYVIIYKNEYILPHAYYELDDAIGKKNQCVLKGTKEEDYSIYEAMPDEDIYEYGKELIAAEIEKEL